MKRSALVFLILLLSVSIVLNSDVTPVKAQGPLADYGDAPDPTYPSLYNTISTVYPGRRGPYHLDVSQEWIGTSAVSTTTVESDALVPDGDFDDGAIQLERVLIGGSPIGQGYVTVPITISKTSDRRVRYLNVAADLDQSGTWQAYSPSPGITEEEWVVANLAIFTEPGTTVNVIVPFALVDPAVAPPDQIWVRATLATEYIDPATFGANGWDGSGPDGGFLRGETEDTKVLVADHTVLPSPSGSSEGPVPGPPPALPPVPGPQKQPAEGEEKEGVPDITQRKDSCECGPTAVANSLYFLGKACGFSGKLPGTPANPWPLIDELKKKMQDPWTCNGVTGKELENGKKEVIKQLGLPIDIRCQNYWETGKKPTKEFIINELKKCEDIEILLTFTDAANWGHYVTVVGYTLYPDGSVRLKIHDPDDRKVGDAYYWLGNREGWISLTDYARPNVITVVCSESCVVPVGGKAVPINKVTLPPPWITLILALSTIFVATSIVILYKRKRAARKPPQ